MTAREPIDLYGDREVAHLRIPPHSIEAESSVLGGLLLDNTAWDRVGDLLIDSDFYRHEHRLIFAAVSALATASKPADVITVFNELEKAGKAGDVGGLAYLHSLSQYVPSAGNLRRYAEIVRERAVLRKLVSVADEIAGVAFNPQGKTVEAILDEAEQKIFGIGEARASAGDDWEDVQKGVMALLDRISAAADGEATQTVIPTGLDDLDEILNGGMRGGQLIVVGGRPGMGKTSLGMTIGLNTAMAGFETGMFSMEMPKKEVTDRQLSMVSYIHLSRIQRPERLRDFDWPNITLAVDKLRNIPFAVSDTSSLNINQLRARARGLKRRRGLRVLIVDYLGLMSGTDHKAPRAYQLEEATKGLKALAKELDIPVLLLAQLSREVEKRPDQMPMLSDLRDTGAAEQDADIVMFVHRPIKVKPDLGRDWECFAKVSVAKQRNGPAGVAELMYVGENTRFMTWPADLPKPVAIGRGKGGDL